MWQQIQTGGKDSGDAGSLNVVKPKTAAKIKGDDDKYAVISGSLEQLDGVRYPECFTELDFLLFLSCHDIFISKID